MRAARAVEPFVVAMLPGDNTTGVFAFLKYKVPMIPYANTHAKVHLVLNVCGGGRTLKKYYETDQAAYTPRAVGPRRGQKMCLS